MVNPKELTALGMTEQQAAVYLTLLELGPSNVGRLVKALGIPRISCYDTLNRLVSRGVVSYAQSRGYRLYHAADPDALLRMADERARAAAATVTRLRSELPALTALKYRGQGGEPDAQIYKTRAGMKSLFDTLLAERKPILVIGATGKALQHLEGYFTEWNRKRERWRIPVKVLFNIELRNSLLLKLPLAEIRFLPKGHSSPSTLFICGDLVVTLLWDTIPFAFLVRSAAISRSYSSYFNILWKVTKRSTIA